MKVIFWLASAIFAVSQLSGCGDGSSGPIVEGNGESATTTTASKTPNILFMVMDDVGIDQMLSFGYGGTTPPSMPNVNAVAAAGIRFRNTWSMPECSPGRAAMFVGRYPLRTQINQAIGPNDLANSQLSTYDMTAPKLLQQSNYVSGMFGKFHLAGPENNQAGNGTPKQLGWDYFYGWVGGLPGSIDTTAGGVGPQGTYSCGFVPSAANGGANSGACYQANNSCSVISTVSAAGDTPGKQCLMSGGILVPNATCQSSPPANLNFNMENAYYVSPLVINSAAGVQSTPLTDSRNRGYRTTIETDAAIKWIKSQSASTPWMATVSYSAAHTPLQQSPSALAPTISGGYDSLNCGNSSSYQAIQNQMTEAMDTEFGRLLVATGLATKRPDGTLNYDPNASNTMIIIVGDNGTNGPSVKSPFNPSFAKGTSYQTGVWVPLIVAGKLVNAPNRDVNSMTNTVDVFQLFGEIAGINVQQAVPRTIDSAPMMPYLKNTGQAAIRTMNFTQAGYNIQANGGQNGPCVISGGTACTQIPVSKSVCEDNTGVWWGVGYTDASVIGPSVGPSSSQGYQQCWQVNQALYKSGRAQLKISSGASSALRNATHKLVQNQTQTYTPATDSHSVVITNELYAINENAGSPALDTPGSANQLDPNTSSAIYNNLLAQLNRVLASQPACPGDANIDGRVNAEDLNIWQRLAGWALSSVADFNFDGLTNSTDQQTIQSHQGQCPASTSVY